MPTQAESLQAGLQAVKQGCYNDAISWLEMFCQVCSNPRSQQYVQAQMSLAKAYYSTGQTNRALALTRKLVAHNDPRVRDWAERVLQTLDPAAAAAVAASATPAATAVSAKAKTAKVAAPTSSTSSSAPSQPSLSPEDAKDLYAQARQALKGKQYPDAIAALETYCSSRSPSALNRVQAQMWLVKAYQDNGQPKEAATLCQQLADSPNSQAQAWARQILPNLLAAVAVLAPGKLKQSAGADRATPPTPPQPLRLKPLGALEAFFRSTLRRDLAKYEKERKKTLQAIAIAGAILLMVAILSLFIIVKYPAIALLLLVAVMIGWVFFYSWFTSSYGNGFKARVIRRIIECIDEGGVLKYGENVELPATQACFVHSTLFGSAWPSHFSQDDCVYGSVGETNIFFSEICAESESIDLVGTAGGALLRGAFSGSGRDRDGAGAAGLVLYLLLILGRGIPYIIRRTVRGRRLKFGDFWTDIVDDDRKKKTLFKGLFFRANFNKSFKGRTVVLPDFAERHLGGMGKLIQSWNKSRGELISLEDPEFERFFAVYGDDQVEARYILSTSLMARLVDLRKKAGRDLYVAFVSDTIYIAVKYEEDLFEPKLYTSMLDFAPIREYYELLELMLAIVEDLNLNRRIWKQV